MGSWVLAFGGMAIVYAAIVSFGILLAAWTLGRPIGWRILPLLFFTLVFVFLTQHPFPVAAGLDCPLSSGAPQLHPFQFLETFVVLHDQGAAPIVWLRNRTVAATVMNFLVCLVIGLAFARHSMRLRSALVFGAVLTLSVELTQLTGIWGLYPCAYRQFNVDDLMLNTLGVVAGVMLVRLCSKRGRVPKTEWK
ncbi:MAG: VanZ family protein [Paracoccaceae bacterium]